MMAHRLSLLSLLPLPDPSPATPNPSGNSQNNAGPPVCMYIMVRDGEECMRIVLH